jgi:serine/threonine-protein kinase
MKPPSIPRMAAVKPASIPRMAAVKPASIPRMAAVKPASIPKMAAVKPPAVEAAPIDGNVTVQMVAAKMPPEALPSAPPPPDEHPSSFPSSGKMLVFESPAPSSLDAVVVADALPSSSIVVTPAHEWLAAHGDADDDDDDDAQDELTDVSSRNRPTLLAATAPKRRWPRVLPVLAVAAVACALLSGKIVRPGATAPRTVTPPTPATATATAPPAPAAAQPEPEPAPATTTASAPTTEPAPAAPAAPDDKGRLSSAGTAPGRRIFVDDRTVGETPNVVVLPCGSHRVRVGSRGTTMILDVPCGGEITVSDR